MSLQKMSIGLRLGLGFALIILLLLGISAVGYWELQKVNQSTDVIVHDRLVKVNATHTIENEINRQSRALRTAIIAIDSDPEVVQSELAKLEASVPVIDKALTQLQATIHTEVGKAALAKLVASRQVFRTQEAQLLALIQQNKSDKAGQYLIKNLLPAQADYLGSVEALALTQLQAIDEFALEASESAQLGENTILATSLAALVLAMVLALGITRSIVLPLSKLQATIKRVETSSDFSLRAPVSGQDEVGQAAKALNDMMGVQQSALNEVNQAVRAMAAGDFGTTVNLQLKGDLDAMKQAINQSVESMKLTMGAINQAMDALSQGRFDVQVSAVVQGEFKRTLDQANAAIATLQFMMNDVGGVMGDVARGNLSGRVVAHAQGDLAVLKTNLNQSLTSLAQAIRVIGGNAQQVAAASSQTSSAVGQISDNAQQQRSAISQVAMAVKLAADSVADVTRNTAIASEKSQRSMMALKDGMQKMADMVQVVTSIAASSEKINGISSVIEKIAYKTNLLSLNAAIEAARAGEQGKGFSVVANEVGALASSSATSSQEITDLVRQAVKQAQEAMVTVQEVSRDMQVIESDASMTNETLQRIASALEEQSGAIEEITANVQSLEQIAFSNAQAAEEMTYTATELNKIADATRQEVGQFQT